MLDKSRKKALFWSVPEDVIDNQNFDTWRTKTILCEGLAGDISLLDKRHIEQAYVQRFLPVRIKKLWSEYFKSEADRKEANMELTALQKKILSFFLRLINTVISISLERPPWPFFTSATGSRKTSIFLQVKALPWRQRHEPTKTC